MRIISWNCCGAGKPEFRNHVRYLKQTYNPHALFIMETRISEERAAQVAPNLGFPCNSRVPTVGFSGGLWLLWDNNLVDIDITAHNQQLIHCIVKFSEYHEWLFTAMYARPNERTTEFLPKSMKQVKATNTLPWLVM